MAAQRIIAGNWKMNLTLSQGRAFLEELFAGLAPEVPGASLLLAPNFTLLSDFSGPCAARGIKLAGQNCAAAAAGALTGETAAAMLKEVGADYVIIGHSERRRDFGEDDGLLRRKASQAAAAGLTPIFCVGENLEERQAGRAAAVVLGQLEQGLQGYAGGLIVAYEPVWAIGTGRSATPADAREMHAEIRRFLDQRFTSGRTLPILYGGSATPDNAALLLAEPNVDGLLVGGAALSASSFLAIARA
ncbi:MAG: triose-phosphate isomerase [Deltaproteobacteria bacterium]|nr:triose-phosphate isomerase [Deltaproteobacteria bacterium]